MDVKVDHISAVRKKLSFEINAEKVSAEIDKAYRKIGKNAKLPGFRPGKVPRTILEKNFAGQMEEQVLTRLINDSYFQALSDHNIPAVGDPEISDNSPLESGKPFTYSAQVEIKPDVEAKDYLGLELKKEKFQPDEKVVEGRLEEMRRSRAELKTIERDEVKEGDFAGIDFEGFIDGEAFPGGKAENHLLEVGSGSLIPGFEEQVVGLKRGEEAEINVTFPEDYGNKELAGRAATFRVTVREIKEKVLPPLDDEFAKGFGLDSMAKLREKMEENYQQQERERIEENLRERLMNALIDRNPVEVPQALVGQQLEYMLENAANRLRSQGLSLEMLGMKEDSFREQYRPSAIRQVQGALILEAVGRQEKIQADDSEVEEKITEIAEKVGADVAAVRKHYSGPEGRNRLAYQVTEEKVIRHLLDAAKIQEVEASELAPAADEGAETVKE